MLQPTTRWRTVHLFFFRVFFLFVLLFIISFNFGYQLLPAVGDYFRRFFESLSGFSTKYIFSINSKYGAKLISDSTGFYVNVFNILVLSIIGAAIWRLVSMKTHTHDRLLYWFTVFVRYYLALHLFIYGFSKVFKLQFYLPEPNTLYTPLGEIPKDLLYWSTMGASAPYQVFLGAMEVMAGLLLLFRRTTLAGAFFASFILINVIAINFAYDISVKIFSSFLAILGLFLPFLHYKRILPFLAGHSVPASHYWKPTLTNSKQRIAYQVTKTIVALALVLESCWLCIRAGNFNDHVMKRPPLHGAYHVETYIVNNDTIPPLQTNKSRWRKVFIHRYNYFIVQDMSDEMFDFKMELDTATKEIEVLVKGEPMQFSYRQPTPTELIFEGEIWDKPFKCILRKLNWQEMPLLKKEFSWTID
jgi:uncharacterized membrane protein YphA (DoxX/SURF4 family)